MHRGSKREDADVYRAALQVPTFPVWQKKVHQNCLSEIWFSDLFPPIWVMTLDQEDKVWLLDFQCWPGQLVIVLLHHAVGQCISALTKATSQNIALLKIRTAQSCRKSGIFSVSATSQFSGFVCFPFDKKMFSELFEIWSVSVFCREGLSCIWLCISAIQIRALSLQLWMRKRHIWEFGVSTKWQPTLMGCNPLCQFKQMSRLFCSFFGQNSSVQSQFWQNCDLFALNKTVVRHLSQFCVVKNITFLPFLLKYVRQVVLFVFGSPRFLAKITCIAVTFPKFWQDSHFSNTHHSVADILTGDVRNPKSCVHCSLFPAFWPSWEILGSWSWRLIVCSWQRLTILLGNNPSMHTILIRSCWAWESHNSSQLRTLWKLSHPRQRSSQLRSQPLQIGTFCLCDFARHKAVQFVPNH